MSSDIRSDRDIPNDPFGKFLSQMARKLSALLAKDQADLVENPEDIYADGGDLDTVLRYHNFVMAKQFDHTVSFSSTAEPDHDKVKLYLGAVFPNIGNQLTDKSGFENHASIFGDPTLIDGTPFDAGVVIGANNTKSIAMRFNRPTSDLVNEEYMTIADNTGLQIVNGIATGFSVFIRLRVSSLAQQGSLNRTFYEKIDDSTPNNAVMLNVKSDGKLIIVIKRGGSVVCQKETASSTILVDTVYEIWLTYAVASDVTHVYVNNVDKTLSANADTITWHTTLTNHDWNIFRRGAGTTGGYVEGDFYHMMIIKEVVKNSTDVSRHFTNKWTTANIPFGQLIISNYWAPLFVYQAGYTSVGYSSVGYTT